MVVDVGNFLQKRIKIYFVDTMLKILDFALLILMTPQKECKRQKKFSNLLLIQSTKTTMFVVDQTGQFQSWPESFSL